MSLSEDYPQRKSVGGATASPDPTQEGDGADPTLPVTVILPMRRWESIDIGELIRARYVFWVLLWRNVRMRYRQTLLGPAWFVLIPLLRMVVFSIVLGNLANLPSDGVPYPLFTYAALLPWTLFQDGVTRSTECLVRYQGILSKIYFPRLFLPMAEVCTALIDFLMSLGILIALVIWYGLPLTPRLLALPFFLALTMALALTLGLALAGLHARFRDVGTISGYFIRGWFFATPVVYSASLLDERLPEWLHWAYDLNPMKAIVDGFRWALLGTGSAPDPYLVGMTVVAGIVLFFSAKLFRATEQSIVDLI